ncbi:MAG: TIGR00296 family protein [Promethearchaeota archaeon]
MSRLLSLEEGITLTQFARSVIESFIRTKQPAPLSENLTETLLEPRGVFVTLKRRRSINKAEWDLRGCIGHLQPSPGSYQQSLSLIEATQRAALGSAFDDPRFPSVQEYELNSILVEVSVLTQPEEIISEDRTKLSKHVNVGKDGLIIHGKGWHRGLLLPQVAPEQGWNAEEFLQGCCQKAGLPPSCFLDLDVRIFKFQAQIFAETSPNGEIIERKL